MCREPIEHVPMRYLAPYLAAVSCAADGCLICQAQHVGAALGLRQDVYLELSAVRVPRRQLDGGAAAAVDCDAEVLCYGRVIHRINGHRDL